MADDRRRGIDGTFAHWIFCKYVLQTNMKCPEQATGSRKLLRAWSSSPYLKWNESLEVRDPDDEGLHV